MVLDFGRGVGSFVSWPHGCSLQSSVEVHGNVSAQAGAPTPSRTSHVVQYSTSVSRRKRSCVSLCKSKGWSGGTRRLDLLTTQVVDEMGGVTTHLGSRCVSRIDSRKRPRRSNTVGCSGWRKFRMPTRTRRRTITGVRNPLLQQCLRRWQILEARVNSALGAFSAMHRGPPWRGTPTPVGSRLEFLHCGAALRPQFGWGSGRHTWRQAYTSIPARSLKPIFSFGGLATSTCWIPVRFLGTITTK